MGLAHDWRFFCYTYIVLLSFIWLANNFLIRFLYYFQKKVFFTKHFMEIFNPFLCQKYFSHFLNMLLRKWIIKRILIRGSCMWNFTKWRFSWFFGWKIWLNFREFRWKKILDQKIPFKSVLRIEIQIKKFLRILRQEEKLALSGDFWLFKF